jgi:hypothetical protein
MERRDIIRVVMLGGATTILGLPVEAWARPVAPEQLGLFSLAFDFLWGQVLEPAIASYITGLVQQEVSKVGREFIIGSQARGANGVERAVVNMSVHKSPSGLLVHGHMLDGNGKIATTHDGTAPSHTHPAMQQHVGVIVGQAHSWLHARGK